MRQVYVTNANSKRVRRAVIISGQYESGGRVSNFWYWKYILADGSLSSREVKGYDNRHPYSFTDVPKKEKLKEVVRYEK